MLRGRALLPSNALEKQLTMKLKLLVAAPLVVASCGVYTKCLSGRTKELATTCHNCQHLVTALDCAAAWSSFSWHGNV